MDTQLDALAAWIDGEPVVRIEVARALETPEGRDYVLDLMALRHLVAVTTPELIPKAPAYTTGRWPALAAAAAVVLFAAGGFAAGRILAPPPATTEVVTPSSSPASIPAPAPTRVIQLEESATWRESGN